MTPRRWYGPSLRIALDPDGRPARPPRASGPSRPGDPPPAGWAVRQRWSGAVELLPAEPDAWPGKDEAPFVRFEPRLLGRGVVRCGADEFGWRRHFLAFQLDSFELLNASEFPLLHVKRRWQPLRFAGSIAIEDAGRRHPRIEPLVMLSWALAVMAGRDGAS